MNSWNLEYLKELIEGNAKLSFQAWFKDHETELQEEMGRASFLRLKFSPIEESLKLLESNKVTFTKNEKSIKREKYYLKFDRSALDENGRINDEFKRKLFNGAIGIMMDGDFKTAEKILNLEINKILRLKSQKKIEELSDLLYFGEIELEYGDEKIGRFIVDLVSKIPLSEENSDDIIIRAKRILQKN